MVESSREDLSPINLNLVESTLNQEIDRKLTPRMQICKRLMPLTLTACAVFLFACSQSSGYSKGIDIHSPTPITVEEVKPTGTPIPLDEPRLFPEKDLSPYDVALPLDANHDLTKLIWYALENGSAKHFDKNDFFHCHVLMARKKYEQGWSMGKFKGTLSEWINSYLQNYDGLLCHTQEYTSNGLDPKKRNVVIYRNKEPFIVDPLDYTKSSIAPYTVYPNDLNETGVLGIEFYPAENGEIELPNRIRLNVTINNPEIYLCGHTPRDMKIDIP